MFGKRIGVDLGTANVLVYVRGRGIVIKEPSVVAVAQRDNSIVAVGGEALDMLGRTPAAISVIRPMRDGVIADYLTTEAMLRYFIGKVVGRLNFIKPEVMVCMPAGVTSVEQRAVRDAAEAAGARRPGQPGARAPGRRHRRPHTGGLAAGPHGGGHRRRPHRGRRHLHVRHRGQRVGAGGRRPPG